MQYLAGLERLYKIASVVLPGLASNGKTGKETMEEGLALSLA